MYWTYVIKSQSTGKLYKGHTNDLNRRMKEHNEPGEDKRKYTHKDPGPWELVYSEKYPSRAKAMKREKYLKSGTGREWLKKKLEELSLQSPPAAD